MGEPMMILCANCDAFNLVDSHFCGICGVKIDDKEKKNVDVEENKINVKIEKIKNEQLRLESEIVKPAISQDRNKEV